MKNETAVLDALEARLAAGEIPTEPESIKLLHEAVLHLRRCPHRRGAKASSTERRRARKRREANPGKPGHGRNGAADYPGAERVDVPHPELRVGDNCPGTGCPGRLYDTKAPATQVELRGGAPIQGTVYQRQMLRCSTCLECFTAPLPAGASGEKNHPSVGATVAVARYEQGMPHHRLQQWQAGAGIPLPASTQFELVENVANAGLPVLRELRVLAATRPLQQTDDTGTRILSLAEENKARGPDERKGLYTSAMLSLGLDDREPPIVLYQSGRRHAGENLDLLLALRGEGCPECIHMADASSMRPRAGRRISAHCMAHARRYFIEIESAFPEHCARVLDDIAAVYRHDRATRGMTPEQRLVYHQTHSRPILEALRPWAEAQIEQRLVEPNSRLGKAFAYLRNHWAGLTRFLEVAGVPLDNSRTERAIKPSQRHRKNSLFYKNELGAAVGDVLMSLIRTCIANRVDPVRYLTAVTQNRAAVHKAPAAWLPWTYLQTSVN